MRTKRISTEASINWETFRAQASASDAMKKTFKNAGISHAQKLCVTGFQVVASSEERLDHRN